MVNYLVACRVAVIHDEQLPLCHLSLAVEPSYKFVEVDGAALVRIDLLHHKCEVKIVRIVPLHIAHSKQDRPKLILVQRAVPIGVDLLPHSSELLLSLQLLWASQLAEHEVVD